MLPQLPLYISLVFGLTTGLTGWFLYRAARPARTVLAILGVWLSLQTGLAFAGFYLETAHMPPRFPVLVLPPLLLIGWLFGSRRGIRFVDKLRLDQLTLLHVVRVPVEIVLFWLALSKSVPWIMTFEGRNYDIFSGLTAPVIYYFSFIRGHRSRGWLIGWNLVCLGLLTNIVVTAALSVPSPFQQLAFDQPNIAILHFPFVWLPSVVVPIVLLAHLAALRQLITKSQPLGMDNAQAM